jgi:hypothetical protein
LHLVGFLAFSWHKLAQLAPWRMAAGVLGAALLAGCLGGPHPLPPNTVDDKGGAADAAAGPDMSPPSAGSEAPPVGARGGSGGTSTSGSAGRGAEDAGVDDCDAGAAKSADAAASLCEDDASVVVAP